MYTDFVTIFIFLIVGLFMVPLMMGVGRLLRPNHPDEKKLSTYECGELTVGPSWVQFNLRFYLIGILFLIFDVEVAVMFPIAVVFKKWVAAGTGIFIFLEIFIFIGILLLGFIYAWMKGDLAWIKPARKM
ncbi:MAG: NADH-quinone oxidoreductase subunit A [Deltaproteobacteria bacterium]|nr:NADH-quinone oxidoreductase subunit A [Deltaproteobacteria bacterium]